MEDGGVRVLAVTRVQVQVEVPDQLAGRAVADAEQPHVVVPLLEGGGLREHEAEELLVDLEGPVHDLVQGEVLLDLVLVHPVLVGVEQLVIERDVPGVQLPVIPLPSRLHVRLLHLLQGLQIPLARLHELRLQGRQELGDHCHFPGHPPLHNVVGVRGIPQDLSNLLPQLRPLVHQLQIVAVRGLAGHHQLLAALADGTVLQHWQQVRPLEGHDDVAIVVLVGVQEVLGHPLQFRPRVDDLRGIIGHVAAVLGTGLAVGGEQLFQFGAGGVVQGQAAPFEVRQEAVQEPLLRLGEGRGLRRGGVLVQHVVHVLAHPELHPGLAQPGAVLLADLANLRVRSAVLIELGLRDHWVCFVIWRLQKGQHHGLIRHVCQSEGGHLVVNLFGLS
mmetsp:Transcript_60795/g.100470  ORF Transcript_60795/g.100470 Transcript_60795/m.100470 type:complete len:388 (-) Transcript_60795:92-1255(-)